MCKEGIFDLYVKPPNGSVIDADSTAFHGLVISSLHGSFKSVSSHITGNQLDGAESTQWSQLIGFIDNAKSLTTQLMINYMNYLPISLVLYQHKYHHIVFTKYLVIQETIGPTTHSIHQNEAKNIAENIHKNK